MPKTTLSMQKNVLDAVNEFYKKNSYFPVAADLKKKLNLKKSMIYRYFAQLEAAKLLSRNGKGHIISSNLYPPRSV